MKKLLVFILLIHCGFHLNARNPQKIVYNPNDSVKLEMDVFTPEDSEKDTARALFIYVHGGGFSSGNKSDGYAICRYLADKGFVAATISYTLYMKDKSFSCDGILSEKVKAIRYAVNDLWQATGYFINHRSEFGIDPARIFIGGCSAGAETVLHAAFWDYDVMNWSEYKLPGGFRYKGVIAGAGALMDINLITLKNLIPVMMFHGTCDNLVPYGTAAHHFCKTDATGWLMLFGSYSIYNKIIDLGGSVTLMTYCNGGHEYANSLFEKDLSITEEFLLNVLEDERNQRHIIKFTGKECNRPDKYNYCN